jgi:hypothetical protein
MNEITIKSVDGTVITIKTDCKSVNVNGQVIKFDYSDAPSASWIRKRIRFRIPYDSSKYIRIIKAIRAGTGMNLGDSKRLAEASGEFSVMPHMYYDFYRCINEANIIVERLDG